MLPSGFSTTTPSRSLPSTGRVIVGPGIKKTSSRCWPSASGETDSKIPSTLPIAIVLVFILHGPRYREIAIFPKPPNPSRLLRQRLIYHLPVHAVQQLVGPLRRPIQLNHDVLDRGLMSAVLELVALASVFS